MDQTRRQIPLPEGRSMFGDVVFFLAWHFSFFHAHLSFVRMSLFLSSKDLDVEKKDKDAF